MTASCTALCRGGYLVRTAGETLQFGVPPETIKDSMKLPGGVPSVFIVPRIMFDLETGVSIADIEFPVYFNFFVRKGKARIVCGKDQRTRIETVLREALFGPERLDVSGEFVHGKDSPGFPDLKAEMGHFKKMPNTATGILTLEDMVEFTLFDERGTARVGDLEINIDPRGDLRVFQGGEVIASVDGSRPIMSRCQVRFEKGQEFHPPVFGITTLGAGHGFDPNASTSGIIIWVNRRGIMVDPPVGSAVELLRLGVSPKWIDKVILTHCHADHDAGTLQKILQEGKVDLYTTATIHDAFMRKSAALTGIDRKYLGKLVRFFPVQIGKTMIIDEGRFDFNYTLHSIPTISIQASHEGKSLVYSSDTMNDPQFISKLHAEGLLSDSRRDALLAFPWEKDVIFHEAGIPPLHTPLPYLCSLPEETRKRMYLVHVNPDLIPKESGLRIAPTGLQNSIELSSGPLPHEDAIEIVDAISRIELFEDLPFRKARDVLLISTVKKFKADEVIFNKGDRGDTFYVVLRGLVDIVLDGKTLTTYGAGGFFGDKSLFVEENRTASAVSKTDSRLLRIDKDDMLSLIRGTESEWLLRQIAQFQNVEMRQVLLGNSVFNNLSPSQQTQLHGLIKPSARRFDPGETIIGAGIIPSRAFIIKSGDVDVFDGEVLKATLSKADLFGVRDIFPETAQTDSPSFSFIARDSVCLYEIDHEDLKQYLDRNPGFNIRLFNHPF